MYKLVEPYRAYLYYHFLKKFEKSVEKMLYEFNLQTLDYCEICDYIGQVLDQVHLPDFVIRFNDWIDVQQDYGNDRYISYFKDSNKKWKSGLINNNVYISQLAEYICNSTLKNIETFLYRLQKDIVMLKEEFNLPSLHQQGSIIIPEGDRHDHGQQPIILTIDKHSIVYKPRDSGNDNLLNDICKIIGIDPVCPKTIGKKDYLWQEFTENKSLDNKKHAAYAFEKYGKILALADMLNINDCHFDNFIVDVSDVWLVDPETSFQYYFDNTPGFERSIYQSGLLQSTDVVNSGIGHTSAITAITNTFQSFTYPHAINDASEKIQVFYERGFYKKTKNFPTVNGYPILALDYINSITDGYSESFSSLKKNKDIIINLLSERKDIKSRYLIRTTAYYLLVINKIIHPGCSRNYPKSLDLLIDNFLHYKEANPLFTKLIPYERECLTRFDVPIFFSTINSRSLYDGDGKEYCDFFPTSPLEQIEKYFNRDNNYLEEQKKLIARSIDAACQKI